MRVLLHQYPLIDRNFIAIHIIDTLDNYKHVAIHLTAHHKIVRNRLLIDRSFQNSLFSRVFSLRHHSCPSLPLQVHSREHRHLCHSFSLPFPTSLRSPVSAPIFPPLAQSRFIDRTQQVVGGKRGKRFPRETKHTIQQNVMEQ